MTIMNHLVIKLCLPFLFLYLSCNDLSEKTVISDDFLCEYLEKIKVDIRLDVIPTPEEFKNDKVAYRLDTRPDSIQPLKVYVWNTEIDPLFDKLDEEINKDFNEKKYEKISLVDFFQESKCNNFKIKKKETLDQKIFKYNNPNKGILLQTSKLFLSKKNTTRAIIFIRLTRHPLDSSEHAIILKKENEKWIYEKSIGISMS